MDFKDETTNFKIDFQLFSKIKSGTFHNNNTGGDGVLGLAPTSEHHDLQPFNFMDQLKLNGYIENKVFSIYTSRNLGNSTHIRFGGYDLNGIAENESLKYIRTINQSTWAVEIGKLSIGGKTMDINYEEKTLQFDPAVPYIYLPSSDFD